MGYPILLVGGNGVPYEYVSETLAKRFSIGRIFDFGKFSTQNYKLLPEEITINSLLIAQPLELPFCFMRCYHPETLVALDRFCGTCLKVLYLKLSLYKRFRLATEIERQSSEDFMNYESYNMIQKIFKSRADLEFDLDEFFFVEKSKMTLEEKLERKLSSLGIHSSKVKNANNSHPSSSTP